MDAKGNQFVWVPVDDLGSDDTARNSTTKVAYLKWCASGYYSWNTSGLLDDTLPTGIADERTQIITYGGFYIGRYESGLDVEFGTESQTTANETKRYLSNKIPIIVEGAIPWNYIDYNKSKANSELMYSNTRIQSGLITGTQWDTTMKFSQNFGGKTGTNNNINISSKNWGNYVDTARRLNKYPWLSTDDGGSWTSKNSTTNGTSQLIRTGASTETKVLNISDMAGNLMEWNNETKSGSRVFRGGDFKYKNEAEHAGYRGIASAGYKSGGVGFRVVLYIK